MLTPFIKRQLMIFTALTVVALSVLGIYYLQIPTLVGIGRYELTANLPASGGLYPTANVTYRGVTIGKVLDVEPTPSGRQGEAEYRQSLQDSDRCGRQCALGVRCR